MQNCVAIGNHALANGMNSMAIGDWTSEFRDNQVTVGEFLFDEPIPERVQQMIREYGPEMHWFIQVVCRRIKEGLKDELVD